MNDKETTQQQPCYFFRFGLLVTGESERDHISKLFRSLMETKICTFEVIRFIGQRSPLTSEKKKLKMVGTGKTIPDKDAKDIGFPARDYLKQPCTYVILLDDLEEDRREKARDVYQRYRTALDTILNDRKHRASVHFLVNMLEAYYFADAEAVNAVLGTSLSNYEEDVETIRHPKNELKKLYPAFHEIRDGGEILDRLNADKVLSRPDTCTYLRTLFAWCSKVLEQYPLPEVWNPSETNQYQLQNGKLSEITSPQLLDLERSL